MKRLVFLLVCLAMSLSLLCGCGGHADTDKENKAPEKTESSATVDGDKKTEKTEKTEKKTDKDKEKSSDTVEIKNGYTICKKCKAIYKADSKCWNCAGERAGLGEQCPGCGGYTGITDVRHSVCKYCGTVMCPLVTYDGFSYDKVHCSDCGACDLDTNINRYGWCDDCTEKNWDGPRCEVCGAILWDSPERDSGKCYDCRYLNYCYGCGKYRSDVFEGYCLDCAPNTVYCSGCGANLTYRGGETMEDGSVLCDDCLNEWYFEQPNVSCPYCGYKFFTSGVGADGLDCPSCGENFAP